VVARIWTVGHSNRSLDEFLAILRSPEIDRLIDVRTVPKSRHNPQFGIDTLPGELASQRVEYAHMPSLGGLRHPRPDSLNLGWRNESFRGFADHMQTEEFERALAKLVAAAVPTPTAIMCAEALPWRCHRSLIADALVVRGIEVLHIMSLATANPHELNPMAVVDETRLTYPGPEQLRLG